MERQVVPAAGLLKGCEPFETSFTILSSLDHSGRSPAFESGGRSTEQKETGEPAKPPGKAPMSQAKVKASPDK